MTTYTNQQAESVLKPQFDVFIQVGDSKDWDGVAACYHPNCVLIQKGKEAHFGREAAKNEFIKFQEIVGDSITTNSNAKYDGTGHYLIITADFTTETQKMGTIKGSLCRSGRRRAIDI